MRISFEAPKFKCPERMLPHVQKVFDGEYDVPLFGQSFRILDVGANYGAFALWAAHRWPSSEIQCYEPHPKTFVGLFDNVKPYPSIHPHELGIGTPGKRLLYDGQNNEGEANFFRETGGVYGVDVASPTVMPEAHILKIDTEGCELEILQPLIEAGRHYHAILVEFHSAHLRTEIDQLLQKSYFLFDCQMIGPNLGVLKYIHREHFP